MKTSGVIVSKKLVLINSLSSLAAKALNATVLIWLYQFLVKRVDASEYSLLPLVGSLMVFAPLLSTVLTGGVGRFILEAHAKGDEHRVRQIVSSMLPILAGASILILVVGGVLVWNVGRLLHIAPDHLWQARVMLGIMLAMLALRLVCAPFGTGLYVHQKYVWSNLIGLGAQLLRVVFLLVLLNGFGTRVLYVVLANAASDLATLIATQVISRRLLPSLRFSFADVHRSVARQVMFFSGWNFVTELGATIRQGASVIILNRLATPVDVTTFDLGSVPDRNVRQTILEATGPVMPALTALHARDERERIRNAFLKTSKYSMFLALAVAMPLIVFGTEFYQLYLGARFSTYAASATVMVLLMAGYPIIYSNNVLFKVAYATGNVRGIAILTILCQLVNVALAIYFVKWLHLGAVGAALGTLLTDCLLQFGIPALILAMRMTDLTFKRWFKELLIPGLLPALVGGAVWFALELFFAPHTWFSLFACGAVGGLAYVASLLSFCLDARERGQLKSVIAKISGLLGLQKSIPAIWLPTNETPRVD